MKTIILSLILASTFACKSSKETVQTEEKPMSDKTETYRTLGTVHLNSKGCPFTIDIEEDGIKKSLYPISLEDKFKVEGLRLRFVYALSRAPQPKDCKCDHVVTLTDVSAIR